MTIPQILSFLIAIFLIYKIIIPILADILVRGFSLFFKKNFEKFSKNSLIFTILFFVNLILLYSNQKTRVIIFENLYELVFSGISLVGFYIFSKIQPQTSHPRGAFGELQEQKNVLLKIYNSLEILLGPIFLAGSIYAVILITYFDIANVVLNAVLGFKQIYLFLKFILKF